MGSLAYEFENDVVVVTGASSGIGRAIALSFAEAGAAVINADIREEPRGSHRDESTQTAAESLSGSVRYVQTDVSNADEMRSVVEAAREYGGVSVMVNNAGILLRDSVLDVSTDDFDKTMAVNARGVLLGSQIAAEDMLERDEPGAIVNLASINSNHAMRNNIAYIASKGAVQMLTYAASLDLADTGINVNAVAPGIVETEVGNLTVEQVRDRVANDEYIKEVPMGRPAKPSEIADGVLYLASDAASYVTGELLHLDGGWHTF